jgi:hypothetical protein
MLCINWMVAVGSWIADPEQLERAIMQHAHTCVEGEDQIHLALANEL